ncbi:histidine-phosphotransfer domain, HPT domain-containing protein [Mycena filopes]|nr:histidine-phosphotransfer domain, HPT domain-containing protein [Mycena filopes]
MPPTPPPKPATPPPKEPAPKPAAKKDPIPDTPRSPPPPAAPESVPDPPAATATSEPIDMDIFSQILELDEEGTYDFSKEMVAAYFAQAKTTFSDMDKAMADEKLPELSSLGHFLKGSSAALGISKVQAACEKMQHYGVLRDEDADADLKADEALVKIGKLLVEVKAEYAGAETWLTEWYAAKGESFEGVKP